MTSEAKKIARLRLFKRIGIIGLIATSSVALLFLVLSLLPQGNSAFTIMIDNPTLPANSNFKMFSSISDIDDSGSKATSYITGEPMKNVDQVDAEEVEDYLSSLEKLDGQQNMTSNDLVGAKQLENPKGLALVYTVYLTNSTQEDIEVKYKVRLDGYNPEPPELLEYFRVLVQTQVDNEISNSYFGQPRSPVSKYPAAQYPNDNNDDREVIGRGIPVIDDEGHSRMTISPTWNKLGNDGYCTNFVDYRLSKDIVESKIVIPVGKAMRFTYVSFFESWDPDSFKSAPSEDNYLLLSLHFTA